MSDNISRICPRKGTAAQWNLYDPVLMDGELGIEIPEDPTYGCAKIKLGDGATNWRNLPYSFDPSDANSIHAGNVGTHKEICIRTGTNAEWIETDPVPAVGEIVFDSTNCEIKIGDGIHKFSELRYVGQTWDTEVVYDFGDYDDPNQVLPNQESEEEG